ncbi:MAG: alpha-xylosidase [Alkalibacterium sp.]|nr:alpha-xylosidase [Alkalibacterium sp.]
MTDKLFAIDENIIQGDFFRFTLITEKLIRMEYSETGVFENRATQLVQHRQLKKVAYELKETNGTLEIITDTFHLVYVKEAEFSPKNLYIDVRYNYSNYTNRWYYGQKIKTLKGTLRTVDRVDGAAELEESIIAKFGYAMLDDSDSFVFDEDDCIQVKDDQHTDVYFFSYGRNYMEAIKDYYRLSGFPPLLPRYALGNWWSRYWQYTESSYLKLIDRFQDEGIPLAVSVIDMDWHLTNVPSKYGSGWTGYTWNNDFFPDPGRFLATLEDKGLAVTLNVHPADGIRAFEMQYDKVADRLNLKKELEEPAKFDLMDEEFRAAYFEDVHHPFEDQGIDFWWIDWQQGEYSTSDIDPLWLLNHYHYQDLKKRGKDALILSRYAGPGSHRYPIGFSGDSVITWNSLNFQPYLTATSSNIGYTWWSHDIGGHYKGYKDEELVQRWFQFGVFSPINRLHSSNSAFSSKEPWTYSLTVKENMSRFLRLRHALIPYIDTFNIQTHEKGIPLVQPVYYQHPFDEHAYDVKNEYFFGSELLVLPITSKKDEETLYGSDVIYFPEGNWFDVFSNFRYKGNGKLRVYREPDQMPVFAREGSIIPLDAKPTETKPADFPEELEWLIYPGQNNTFELVEDKEGKRSLTVCSLESDQQTLSLSYEGMPSTVQKNRVHTLHFNASEEISLEEVKGAEIISKVFDDKLRRTSITIKATSDKKIEINFSGFNLLQAQDITSELFKRLNTAQVGYFLKDDLFNEFTSSESDISLMATVNELEEEQLSRSLFELLYIKNS